MRSDLDVQPGSIERGSDGAVLLRRLGSKSVGLNFDPPMGLSKPRATVGQVIRDKHHSGVSPDEH